jgi:hypothetical protein
MFKLPENYNFDLDSRSKKKTNAQKEFKEFLTQDMGNEQTPVTAYLINNSYRLTQKDIPDIFNYINTVAGENVINGELQNVSGSPHLVYKIEDTDLVKQQQIKQIRAINRGTELTKKQLAGKVWKYSYLPPSLESDYFERNVGDNKNLTKIKQLVPTNPFKRNEYIEQTPHDWVRPGLKSEYFASKKNNF